MKILNLRPVPKSTTGFTLIELLVVISIVSLLSSVILSNLSAARVKARDARRAEDMHQIMIALNLFYDQYGCLPTTSATTCAGALGYSEANAGSWDYSSQGGFLPFLSTGGFISVVPLDPKNNMTGDGTPAGSYGYRYYCYTGGATPGLHVGYWSERTGAYVMKTSPLVGGWTDNTYTCR